MSSLQVRQVPDPGCGSGSEALEELKDIFPIDEDDSNAEGEIRSEGQVASDETCRLEGLKGGFGGASIACPAKQEAKKTGDVERPDHRGHERADEERHQDPARPHEAPRRAIQSVEDCS